MDILMPQLGETVTEGTVTNWYKQIGDAVRADEALFEAGIRPERPAKSLSTEEVERLHRAIRSVLALAMGNRGSSFRDYLDTAGREGEHQLHMKVFRRTGQACQRCGSVIERSKIGGRSTHYCPKCQG